MSLASQTTVECRLCPKRCKLAPLERGDCRVRVNRGGELRTLVYGKPCALHIDPVEKKPMYHFLPGTRVFSLATAGCNLHCRFCQNWRISQSDPEDTNNEDFPPEKVVAAAVSGNCRSIAYTYTEPVTFFEYTLDTSRLAVERGLKNIMVTAGYIEPEPLEELCQVIHGANVDLKSFDDRYYREVCDGRLKPVMKALEIMVRHEVLVEITNLIVPSLNDDIGMIREMCAWIKETLGPETPLHFSRFHPQYRMTGLPPTPHQTLVAAAEAAGEAGLKYIYVGNIRDRVYENTYCPQCGKLIIGRIGYRITALKVEDGKCAHCGQAIHGIWR